MLTQNAQEGVYMSTYVHLIPTMRWGVLNSSDDSCPISSHVGYFAQRRYIHIHTYVGCATYIDIHNHNISRVGAIIILNYEK